MWALRSRSGLGAFSLLSLVEAAFTGPYRLPELCFLAGHLTHFGDPQVIQCLFTQPPLYHPTASLLGLNQAAASPAANALQWLLARGTLSEETVAPWR